MTAIAADPGPTVLRDALVWRSVACNLCGRDEPREVHRERLPYFGRPVTFSIVHCRNCGLVYTNPRLAESNAVYLDTCPEPAAIEAHAAAKREVFISALDQLDALAVGDSAIRPRLLDLGAGSGHFVAAARERGYYAVGLEPAAAWVDYARDRLKVPVHQADVSEAEFPLGAFDVITAWDVLEHVDDPRSVLTRAAGWLRPGGIFAARFPSAGFQRLKALLLHGVLHSSRAVYAPTMHLTFFSAGTFAALARDTGLVLLTARSTPLECNTGRPVLDAAKRTAALGLGLAQCLTRRPLGNLECYCRKDDA